MGTDEPGRAATNVLFIWDISERLRAYLSNGLDSVESVRLLFPEDLGAENLVRLAPEADVIVGWRPSDELLDAAGRLTLLINPGAGVQHIAERVSRLGRPRPVRLANGHGNAYFTAQHAVALLLALSNRVVPHHNWMADGRWRTGDSDAASIPMRDRTIGLLGYGAVNRQVHKMLSGFDVRFAILRRHWPDEDRRDTGPVRLDDDSPPGGPRKAAVSGPVATQYLHAPQTPPLPAPSLRFDGQGLTEFLSAVDTLVVAVPLTEETDGLIGRRELELLGSDGLLVQMARGDVVDQLALYEALRDGVIAGAAIDVWYDYRPEPDSEGHRYPYSSEHPFHTLPNAILSPHRGASPFDDLGRWDEVIENIKRVAAGRDDLLNLVDLERGY